MTWQTAYRSVWLLTAQGSNLITGRETVDAGGKILFLVFLFFFLEEPKKKRGKLIKTKHIFPLASKLLKVGFEFQRFGKSACSVAVASTLIHDTCMF